MTEKRVSDVELINGFKKGSEKDFEELILRYENKIYSIALRYTKSAEDAEEVLQDVCLTLYKKVQEFQGKSAFSSWLYRIVVNAALMKLRKRRQEKATFIEDLSITSKKEFFEKASEELQRADTYSIQHETRAALEDAINKLADEYKAVFIMRDIDGLSNQEVSKALNISVPAVKSRLHRARLMLRKKLERYWKDYNGIEPMANLAKSNLKTVVNG